MIKSHIHKLSIGHGFNFQVLAEIYFSFHATIITSAACHYFIDYFFSHENLYWKKKRENQLAKSGKLETIKIKNLTFNFA